jgi:hypothetical protein
MRTFDEYWLAPCPSDFIVAVPNGMNIHGINTVCKVIMKCLADDHHSRHPCSSPSAGVPVAHQRSQIFRNIPSVCMSHTAAVIQNVQAKQWSTLVLIELSCTARPLIIPRIERSGYLRYNKF